MTPEELCAKYRNAPVKVAALSGLDEVDWSSLQHAYGAASDFPALLKAALSEIEMEREFAQKLLHETIWHQGSIYQATAFAVPFIVALIQSDEISNQIDFAMLLASIAEGKGDFEDGFQNAEREKMWREAFAKSGIDLDERIAENRKWARATRDAVRPNLHLLYPFLAYPDKYVRPWIAEALACYPELAAETLPMLNQSIEAEEDQETREWLEKARDDLKSRLD